MISLEEAVERLKKFKHFPTSREETIESYKRWIDEGDSFIIAIDLEYLEDFQEYAEIKNYLENRRNKEFFIFKNKIINCCVIEMYKTLIDEYSLTEVTDLMERHDEKIPFNERTHFKVELECEICSEPVIESLTKTKFTAVLKDKYKCICPSCLDKKNDEEKKQENDQKIQNEISIKENTEDYIDTYLNIKRAWSKELTIYNKINLLTPPYVDWNVISDHIKAMKYSDFLQTPYWKAITLKKMKQANFRCQICNNKGILATHHRTYDIHGDEIHNLNELIVLCDECHKKYHDH